MTHDVAEWSELGKHMGTGLAQRFLAHAVGVALPRSYVSEPTLRLCIPTCTSVVAVPVRSSLLDGYMFFGLPTDSRLVVVPKLQIHSTYVPSSEPSPASLIQSSKILHDLTPHTWGPSAYIVAPASPLLGCQQYCHCWDCRNSCTLSQMLQIVLDSLRQLVKKSPRQHRVYDTMCTSGQGAGCTHHQANQHNTSLLLLPPVPPPPSPPLPLSPDPSPWREAPSPPPSLTASS